MGANHNTKRYGELWPDFRVELGLEVLNEIKEWAIISGGWAWHFMSPPNHTEYKHAHDHKDIDIFVHPKDVAAVMVKLQELDFEKVWTRYDHLQSDENFRRYEKVHFLETGRQVRVTIDFFESKTIDCIEVEGWKVVAPKTLLSYYSNIHSSTKCWAVQAAVKLLGAQQEVVRNQLLVKNPLS